MAKGRAVVYAPRRSADPKRPGRAAARIGATVTVSREVLDATPGRLFALLRGIGTRPAIRAVLAEAGYTAAEHERGWQLLFECSGRFFETAVDEVDEDVVEAMRALDRRDEQAFHRIDASLRYRAPNARAALLQGLTPGTGAESTLFFSLLLPRLDALARGKLPHVSAAEQRLAAEVLAERGLGARQREELEVLVGRARSAKGVEPRKAGPSREDLDVALRAARAFYEEWATLARSELRRRDHLIFLGLATRRSPTRKPADDSGIDEAGAKNAGADASGAGDAGVVVTPRVGSPARERRVRPPR